MSQQPGENGRRKMWIGKVVRQLVPAPRPGLELPVLPDRVDRLLGVFEATGAWITEWDAQGHMKFVSPNVESIIGFTTEQCLTSDCLEFHPDDLPEVIAVAREVRTTGKPASNVVRIRHRQGHWVWIETTLLGWHASGDQSYHAVSVHRDITELKTVESAKRESEERYRVVAEASRDMITEMDKDGRLHYASPTCGEVLGYALSELVGMSTLDLFHPDDRDQANLTIEAAMKQRTPHRLNPIRVRRGDGSWIWVEGIGIRYERADGEIHLLAVTRDVTERRRAQQERRELEERMLEAQHLESLGVLAGGVAHDFNNLLTPILGEASLALMDLPAESTLRARFQKVQRAAERAAMLTNQLLAYGGKKPLHVEPLSLSQLVQEMTSLVESAISSKAVLGFDLPEDLPAIEADAAQVSQVVMNMITNASEAVGDGEGRVTVRTGTVHVDRASLGEMVLGNDLPEGTYVYFETIDTGCGMDAETRSRIFDPFFTTKFTGRGLGLAAALGIVRGHGGAIEIESEVGKGTRFRVLFPSSSRPHESERTEPFGTEQWSASGTVLVVEDDEQVRELAEDTLERTGLSVLCAADGREGVEVFRRHADEIRVVLLDQTMPALSGEKAFNRMREICPDVPIILVSGYSEEGVAKRIRGRGLSGFLRKPFLPTTLIEKVRQVIETG